jgi:hypothetical protein
MRLFAIYGLIWSRARRMYTKGMKNACKAQKRAFLAYEKCICSFWFLYSQKNTHNPSFEKLSTGGFSRARVCVFI